MSKFFTGYSGIFPVIFGKTKHEISDENVFTRDFIVTVVDCFEVIIFLFIPCMEILLLLKFKFNFFAKDSVITLLCEHTSSKARHLWKLFLSFLT
jgi:hypothetical protein